MSKRCGRTFRSRQKRQPKLANPNELELLTWMPGLLKEMSNRGWTNPRRLKVQTYSDNQRGLGLKRGKILVGDELIRLPTDCLISMATLENDVGFKSIFRQDALENLDNAVSIQTWLSFYLLYQKHRQDNKLMQHYIRSLPTKTNVPLFCTCDEIINMPAYIIEHVVKQTQECRAGWRILLNALKSLHCDCCQNHLNDIFDLHDFQVAWFIVNTRSIYIDFKNNAKKLLPAKCDFMPLIKDNPNMALAPFLDMFNHSDKVSTKVSMIWSDEHKRLELVVKLTGNHLESPVIKPMHELFISYGEHNDFNLLMEYGMVLKDNQHNYYNLLLRDISEFVREVYTSKGIIIDKEKFVFLRTHNFDDTIFVHKHNNCMSHNLHVILNLLFVVPNGKSHNYASHAFGNVDKLSDCTAHLAELLQWRCLKYNKAASELLTCSPLTESGGMLCQYLLRTQEYLQEIMISLFADQTAR